MSLRSLLITSTALMVLFAGGLRAADTRVPPLERLKAGNARFVADPALALPVDAEKRQAQLKGQSPFAMVLSCADSRVPPELVFNVGLGELFVVRSAGGTTDKAVLASLEYAAEHLHVPLLVVMGHESCGAVVAATKARPGSPSMGPNLDYLVKQIRPAFDRMTTEADQEHLREAVLANVEEVVNDILKDSQILRKMQEEGELQVVGAYYELATGRVRFSAPVPTAAPAHPTTSPETHR